MLLSGREHARAGRQAATGLLERVEHPKHAQTRSEGGLEVGRLRDDGIEGGRCRCSVLLQDACQRGVDAIVIRAHGASSSASSVLSRASART